MSRRIFKYPIKITDVQTLNIPVFGSCINVGVDTQGTPCMWFDVNTALEPADREVYVVGTGNPIPDKAIIHVGSFNHGPFVWHVYLNQN